MTIISVNSESPDLKPAAQALATRLNLAYSEHTEGTDYQILLTSQGLALQKSNDASTPLYLDFRNGKTNYRRLHTSLRRETLARAMGLKNHTSPKIVDATAGLARDGFMLASLGFEITLLERSPIIYALLEDAIKRAELDKEIAPIVQRLQLVQTDAVAWMEQVSEANRPDIIYLDPMFPARTKSALVKKDMRYFHDIVGEDNDSARLLPAALACAARRVVVKRPRLAEHLAAISPNFSQEGSSSRFDVYLTR